MRCADLPHQSVADIPEKLGRRFIAEVSASLAGVTAYPDADVDRHFAKKRHVEFRRPLLRTARAEDVVSLAAIRADEVAHVLDHAEHRNMNLAEHRDSLHGIEQRNILRSTHDDCTR